MLTLVTTTDGHMGPHGIDCRFFGTKPSPALLPAPGQQPHWLNPILVPHGPTLLGLLIVTWYPDYRRYPYIHTEKSDTMGQFPRDAPTRRATQSCMTQGAKCRTENFGGD